MGRYFSPLIIALTVCAAAGCNGSKKAAEEPPKALLLYDAHPGEPAFAKFTAEGRLLAQLMIPPGFVDPGTRIELSRISLAAVVTPDDAAMAPSTDVYRVRFLTPSGASAPTFGEAALDIAPAKAWMGDLGSRQSWTALYQSTNQTTYHRYFAAAVAEPAEGMLRAAINGDSDVRIGVLRSDARAARYEPRPGADRLGLNDQLNLPRCAALSVTNAATAASLTTSPVISWTPTNIGTFDHYEIAIGTTAGASDAKTWASVGSATSTTVSGLSLSNATSYYASVRAITSAGAVTASATGPAWVTATASPPTAGVALSFGAVTQVDLLTDSVVVNWGAATDPNNPASSLQYRLVAAYDQTQLNSAAKISACVAPCQVIADWTTAAVTATASSVNQDNETWFAVAVRNSGGGVAAYSPLNFIGPVVSSSLQASPNFDYYYASRSFTSNDVAVRKSTYSAGSPPSYAAFAMVGGGNVSTNVLDGSVSVAVTSAGTAYVGLEKNVSCTSPPSREWVSVAQGWVSAGGGSWTQIGDLSAGSINCTTPPTNASYLPHAIVDGTTPYLSFSRSNGGAYISFVVQGTGGPPATAWAEQGSAVSANVGYTALAIAGSDILAFGVQGVTSTFRVHPIGAGGSWTNAGTFGVTNVDEFGSQPGQRIGTDSSGDYYAAYVDKTGDTLAHVRKYSAGAWAALGGPLTTGKAMNVNLVLVSDIPYVLVRDGATGGKANLLKWNSGTLIWDIVVTDVFNGDVMAPVMTVTGTTINMAAISVADKSRAVYAQY